MSTNSSHPDANLHPCATGLASKTVSSHASKGNTPLTLYSGWFCPFVQRVWMCLEEKHIPYTYVEVNPYHKPQSLLKLNPRGLVPTLEHAGRPLYESTVICEFLEEAYPADCGFGPALLPTSNNHDDDGDDDDDGGHVAYERARCRIWIDFVGSRIIPAFHRFLQFQPMSDGAGLKAARDDFVSKLGEFVREMDAEGPFFLGSEISLVDIALAPWGIRLWVFDHYKQGLRLPISASKGEPKEGNEKEEGHEKEKKDAGLKHDDDDDDDDDENTTINWTRLDKWLTAISARPSVANTTSEREYYLSIYQRYADDEAQSELAKATRKGRGVP